MTVAASPNPNNVSALDRAGYLEVQIFAGGSTTLTLDDGTVLSQSAPTTSFAPTAPTHGGVAIPLATSSADLATCAACYFDDPSTNVFSIAVQTKADTITAGPLTVSVAASPVAKQYVFTVRH